VSDADNRTVGVISMVLDVTERKAVEDELARYRENLEELVQKRSEQLEKAQDALVQKERLAVLGQLTATVSHEIRNPLGTVSNSLYLLKESLKDPEFKHLERPLLLAERNVERCDMIISELLDFSRQRNIEKQLVNIDDWLTSFFAETPAPKNISVAMNLSANEKVPVDVERFRRVLVNLTTNAFQALEETDNDKKILTVKTKIVAGRGIIEFRDNGPGMSKEILSRIHEPMFSTKNFGVGLGVPIIKSIIEKHGGEVHYQSQEGEGTTVTVSLPLQI
jgi:signal transduction histidine kinase